MKKLLTITFLLIFGGSSGQDFIKKSNGTFEKGIVLRLENNIITILNEQLDTLTFRIEDLSIIHISNVNFVMKNLQLQNAQFRSDRYGTTIIFPENNLKSDKKVVHEEKALEMNSKS